jgi:two-component system alkaline phosphatase synthesis response regulator PhoP
MIYFVEDDVNIRELVVYTLQNTGFEAKGFPEGAGFWVAMEKELPDMVLLDIMLPAEDGLSILRKIRSAQATSRLPVIMLTAKGTEFDKVLGLDMGADDYLPKPFGMMELVARVRSLLRRSNTDSPELEYSVGSLYINVPRHVVKVEDSDVRLTLKEFDLLIYLAKNAGIALSRDQILDKVWGYDFDGETRTVDVHVRTLRGKLGQAGDLVQTVRGVGYKLGELD